MEEIWSRELDDRSGIIRSHSIGPESVKDNTTNDESSAGFANVSSEISFENVTSHPLSGSETTEVSSSFVKEGFDQTDLESLEAEIARELQD